MQINTWKKPIINLKKAINVNEVVAVNAMYEAAFSPKVNIMQGLIHFDLAKTYEHTSDPMTIPAYTTDPSVPYYKSLIPMSLLI